MAAAKKIQVAPPAPTVAEVEHGAGGRADDDARKEDGESPALAGRGSNADARTVLTGTTHSVPGPGADSIGAATVEADHVATSPAPTPVSLNDQDTVSCSKWEAALAQRDETMARFLEVYPDLCENMRALLADVRTADARVRAVNSTRGHRPPIATVLAKIRKDAGAKVLVNESPFTDLRLPNILSDTPKRSLMNPRTFIADEKYPQRKDSK